MPELDDRWAVVTGAGNGLGRAIALELARNGASVALLGRDASKLLTVSESIANTGGNSAVIVCDTTNAESVEGARKTLEGREVSILINNAGVAGPVAELVGIDPREWDDVFAVNVRGVFLMCRAFLPSMLERGSGDIINVSSVAAKRPLAGRTPYGASKAAVLGLTVTLAAETAANGVKVNSLSPGPVAGPRMAQNFEREARRRGITVDEAEQEYVSRAASQRMVTEAEVAAGVLGILSMSGLHGADIDMTAGMFAR